MSNEAFEKLQAEFAALGDYELHIEEGEPNPYTVVKLYPKRFVLWRTRVTHALHAILRTIQAERGLRHV